MKRNWDMIRDILTRLEEYNNDQGCLNLANFPEDRHIEVSYNMELLLEASLVKGEMLEEFGSDPEDFFVTRLTWQGHEFLDAIRNDTIWQKTKKSFLNKGVSMTFDLVKSVAVDFASAFLKTTISS